MVEFGFVTITIFNRQPFKEQLVKGAVVVDQYREFGFGDSQSGFFKCR
jgi:hypothetical protein